MSSTDTNVNAAKVCFPRDDPIQVHQTWESLVLSGLHLVTNGMLGREGALDVLPGGFVPSFPV